MSIEKQHTLGAENNDAEENEWRSNDQVSKTQSAGKVIEVNWTYWSLYIFLYSGLAHSFNCLLPTHSKLQYHNTKCTVIDET